jgi:hypothetical protein
MAGGVTGRSAGQLPESVERLTVGTVCPEGYTYS